MDKRELKIVKTPWGQLNFIWEELTDFYEKEVWEHIDCKIGDIAFDIGAHQGFYTLMLAHQVGCEGWIFSFEPEPNSPVPSLRK